MKTEHIILMVVVAGVAYGIWHMNKAKNANLAGSQTPAPGAANQEPAQNDVDGFGISGTVSSVTNAWGELQGLWN